MSDPKDPKKWAPEAPRGTTTGQNMFINNLPGRHRRGKVWGVIFLVSTVVGIVVLSVLLIKIFNDTMGYAAFEYKRHPDTLTTGDQPLNDMTCAELLPILQENVSANRFRTLELEKPFLERSQGDCYKLVIFEVAEPVVKETWSLLASLLRPEQIKASAAEKYPEAELTFKFWITQDFVTSPQSDDPLQAGIRTAILGTLYIIAIVILVALPLGVGAAIYLEEYATESRLNRIIQTNINNLAGVPSIIYGMLGLALFVRALEPIISGSVFGFSDPTTANGRTILAAGLTLSLLILPIVIINGQEAIRAVPNSLREASYGMGATKWQTVWYHILPYSLPGILTGLILSVSRAFGETAPLIVIGAATFITFDPESIFSKFTTIPIQIYQWTSRPQDGYRNIAAAAIIVLLILLLALNTVAILLRNRYGRRLT